MGSRTQILQRDPRMRARVGHRRRRRRPPRGRQEARGTGAEAERPKPKGIWESEGRIRAMKVGNDWHRTHRSKGGQLVKPRERGKGCGSGRPESPCQCEPHEGTM
jgi:hypothetical protein